MPEISATALEQLRSSLVKFNEELEPLPRIFDGTNDLVALSYKPDEHSVRAIRRYLDDLSWTGDADQFGSRLQSLQGAIFELYRVRAGMPGAKRVTRRNLPGATLPRFRSDAAFNEAYIFAQMRLGREAGNFRRFISGLIERLNQYVRARVIHRADSYRRLGMLPVTPGLAKQSGKPMGKRAKRKRRVRTTATAEMLKAHELNGKGLTLRAIRDAMKGEYGTRAPKSPTTISKWIAIAESELNPKSRSVSARHRLPYDRRGQANVTAD